MAHKNDIKVVVVEDEALVADDIKRSLVKSGFSEPAIFAYGREVIDYCRGHHADLAVMDIKLKGAIDGIDAALEMKKLRIPVIFVTAYGDRETLERAKRAEPLAFIHKPFDTGNLVSIIEIALHKYRLDRELRDKEEKFRTIIEHSNEIFYIHGPDHIFTYVSPTCEKILGYTPDEMKRRWMDICTDNPLNREAKSITERALSTGRRQPPYLVEVVKKGGGNIFLELDESPLIGESGEVTGITGAARDVSRRIIYEKELEETNRELEKMNQLMVGRETRMMELKEKIARLEGAPADKSG